MNMEKDKIMKTVDFLEPDIPKGNAQLPEGTSCSIKIKNKHQKRKGVENDKKSAKKTKSIQSKKPKDISTNDKKNAKKTKSIQSQDPKDISTSHETNTSSQKSYKSALSQPPQCIRHKDRMLWLQDRRDTGIWVNCDHCKNWGYMPNIHDPLELPEKWDCSMNPDIKYSKCFGKEKKLQVADEEDLIHNQFSAGSLVWAKMSGYPWWPAMVDDCPDIEQYYWLDGFSDIPTYYNVVFFDSVSVTRGWITPDCLKPFSTNPSFVDPRPPNKFKTRLHIAKNQARDAKLLPIKERLRKYSFVIRYTGPINSPLKPSKKQKRIAKRKYFKTNVQEFIDTSSSDSSRSSSPCLETAGEKTIQESESKEVLVRSLGTSEPFVSLVSIEELLQQTNGTPSLLSTQSPPLKSSANLSSYQAVPKKKNDKKFLPPTVMKFEANKIADSDDISVQNRKTVKMIIDSCNTEDMRSDKAECGESSILLQSSDCQEDNLNSQVDDLNILNLEFTERDFDLLKNDAVVPSTSEEVTNLDLISQNSDDFDF